MSESMNKPKESGRHRWTRLSALGKGAGVGRIRRAMLFFVGVAACAAAAVLLVLVLIPKTLKDHQGPDGTGTQPLPPPASVDLAHDSTTAGDEPRTADKALKKETFDVVRQLMADFPGSSYPIGLMGTVHNNYGSTAEAEKWWKNCLERNPKRADVYHVLGMAAMRKGEYEKVAELLRKAQAINPNLPGVHGRYAEAFLEMGKLDEALAALEKELRISPGLSNNYVLLGKIYLQRVENEKAVGAYTKALQLSPHDSGPYYGLATACARLGQRDKAREYMETFKKLRAKEDEASTTQRRATNKPRPTAQILVGTLIDAGREYYEHQQFGKAEEYWRRAAILDPVNTGCRLRLVDLYKRTGRGREAVEVCEQLQKIYPKNASYHLMTGVVLAELKRFDAAEGAMRKAIELAPKRAAGYRSLAEVLLLRDAKLPEAKALAEKLVALEPTARHYALLSKACFQNEDRFGALAAMKRAAELAPDNQKLQEAYKRLQERQ
jgi:tetratricopeptide (TPR) repeat protein